MSGGEALFQRRQKSQGSSFLDGIGAELTSFLCEREDKYLDHIEMQRKHLHRLREINSNKNEVKIALMKARKVNLILGVDEKLRALPEKYMKVFETLGKNLDDVLMSITLRYYATIEAEMNYIQEWKKEQDVGINMEMEEAKMEMHLRTFAVYLESETGGSVKLLRLAETHPQGLRCSRAAIENMKKTPGLEMRVMNVYKIEHEQLLAQFQSEMAHGHQIKGLFCSISAGSLERCIAYGMEEPNSKKFFRDSWYSIQGRDKKYAEQLVSGSAPIEFPKRFSRYSTLKEHKKDDGCIQFLGLCRVLLDSTAATYLESEVSHFVSTKLSVHHLGRFRFVNKEPPEPIPQNLQCDITSPNVDLPRIRSILRFPDTEEDECISGVPQLPHILATRGLRKTRPELFQPKRLSLEEVQSNCSSQRAHLLQAVHQATQHFWTLVHQAWSLHAHKPPSTINASKQDNNEISNERLVILEKQRALHTYKTKLKLSPSPYRPSKTIFVISAG
ncbi:hypothetical protein THRCLA_21880 [Thraustotheca clavata]|uniref:Uncharacterized protein n=1 Tax=Thraustotheca clavata TaxID=74557 RepID=A0A1V9ZL62_9STRA|nr:hypothetical protein THRCLA_21880 [Thraustotheca clavata]